MAFGPQPNTIRLLKAPDEACPRHPLTLAHCRACGFVLIPDPMPAEAFYGEDQPPTSRFPPRHLPELVQDLACRLATWTAPRVYEIGCNDGHFLDLLRAAGVTELDGIEPSAPCAGQARDRGLAIRTGFFGPAAAEARLASGPRPDAIICRHVLEHVEDLEGFLSSIARLLAPGGLVLLEVPDLAAIQEQGDFSAIWEQHVNYFDHAGLARLCARFGLRVREARRLPHGGGTLLAYLERGQPRSAPAPAPAREGLRDAIQANLAELRQALQRLRAEGARIAGFGAGMRGTMLLNLAGVGAALECVLDDDPAKTGRFLPGSGLAIRDSSWIRRDPPECCLVLPLNSKQSEVSVMERLRRFQPRPGRFIEILPAAGGFLEIHP